MNQVLSDLKTGSIELILRGTDLYVSNGDLLESTISGFGDDFIFSLRTYL